MSLSTVRDDVSAIQDAVAECAPAIRDGIVSRRHALAGVNPSGDSTLAADAYADELLEATLTDLDAVGEYASEERMEVTRDSGPLSCCVDPLDGSKNVESANAAGTIFAIYDEPLPARGTDLVAAGYVVYGSVTTMVLASGGTVTPSLIADDGTLHTVLADVLTPLPPTVCGVC
jgi:fructose-1,6-bisphosphatase I